MKIYSMVFKKLNIAREFNDREIVLIAVDKIFGEKRANTVKGWLDEIKHEGTYADKDLTIHCINV